MLKKTQLQHNNNMTLLMFSSTQFTYVDLYILHISSWVSYSMSFFFLFFFTCLSMHSILTFISALNAITLQKLIKKSSLLIFRLQIQPSDLQHLYHGDLTPSTNSKSARSWGLCTDVEYAMSAGFRKKKPSVIIPLCSLTNLGQVPKVSWCAYREEAQLKIHGSDCKILQWVM